MKGKQLKLKNLLLPSVWHIVVVMLLKKDVGLNNFLYSYHTSVCVLYGSRQVCIADLFPQSEDRDIGPFLTSLFQAFIKLGSSEKFGISVTKGEQKNGEGTSLFCPLHSPHPFPIFCLRFFTLLPD